MTSRSFLSTIQNADLILHPTAFLFFLYSLWASPILAASPDPSPPGLLAQESVSRGCQNCHQGNRGPTLLSFQESQCQQCHSPDPELPANPPEAEDAVEDRVKDGLTNWGARGPLLLSRGPKERKSVEMDEVMIKQRMILIPAGEFVMGNNGRGTADGPGDLDETPSHRVYVEAFYIDQHETTNTMYQEFLEATRHRTPKHWNGNRYPPGKANHPVIYVDWYDADKFCRWSGKRLPTEEEWEKAARGADGRIFPWGNSYDSGKANTPQYWLTKGVNEDSLGIKGGTLPVGSFENGKSPYGAYDMAGNVYEWTSSWYLPYPGNKDWNIHYGHKNKVLRGGSWYDCLSYGCGLSAPTYNRSRFSPEIRNMGFGFRCAKSLE